MLKQAAVPRTETLSTASISHREATDPPHDTSGPLCLAGDDRVHPDLPVEVLSAVDQAVAEACTTRLYVPPFGSWAWCRLAEGDPARGHAVMRAAWAWWLGHVVGPGVSSDVIDRAVSERLAAASRDVHAADPELWRRVASRPTREEIERRRSTPGGPPLYRGGLDTAGAR